MEYAPIVVFGFNRPDALRNTISSLLLNEEAKDSDLFVFVDGPREGKVGEKEKVEMVRDFVKSITGFKSLHYTFSEKNSGLASSIIEGVSQVIKQYGRAIILEDDLVVAPNFLSFMNQGLECYENEQNVFSICGYSNKVKVPAGYMADAYFCVRNSSWGWGTWVDRWNSVDWSLDDWKIVKQRTKGFNHWGGSDSYKMLRDWHNGRNQSWAIRFCYAQFVQDKVSLFPITSKVANRGFDGDGTNCKRWSRFKFDLDLSGNKNFTFPSNFRINPVLLKSALSYHTIWIRLWSRLMYLIH